MDFPDGQVYFQITCLDEQVEILDQYQFLFTITSLFSLRQAKFGVTRPDGQVGLNS